MTFEMYFLLMKALHVNWLSIRHQFSLITASALASRMVYPMFIMMALPFFILLLIGSVGVTSCVEFWNNTSLGDGGFTHSSVGDPITRLQEGSLMFSNAFCSPPPGVLLEDFSCFKFLNASASSLRLA